MNHDELDVVLGLRACLYQFDTRRRCFLQLNSPYVQELMSSFFKTRELSWRIDINRVPSVAYDLQLCEYEEIDWDVVLAGETRGHASGYCVRKGMTRKAAWAQVVNRWVQKYGKSSVLGRFVPETIILSTWDAFSEDGGWLAKFGVRDKSLALAEALRDAEDVLNGKDLYVLKPSIANKGSEVTPVKSLEEVKTMVKEWQDCREWVLQKYVPNLLLLDGGRKFHLRVFIVCVGALRVHLFKEYIGFFSSSPLDKNDHWAHITNAAHQRDHSLFDESAAFKLPHEMASLSEKTLGLSPEEALRDFTESSGRILTNLGIVIAESFKALKSTPAVFQPHPNCFELFGLDFLVDRNLDVHLLEFNSGPDLDQARENRLSPMIERLINGWYRLGVEQVPKDDRFVTCYEEEWSHAINSQQKLYETDH